jgi:lipopolysaccharide export LptBFGC system permease protein LptF
MKKKYIIFFLPVVAVLITLFIRFGIPEIRQQITTRRERIREGQTTESQLSENWQVNSESENEVILVRQEETQGVQTRTVLLKSETENENFAGYVDRLIRGAQQTLPSLEYDEQSEIETVDDWQKKELAGFYFSGGDRVNIKQDIYYQDGQVVTITASYGEENKDDIQSELNDIFDFLTETYL